MDKAEIKLLEEFHNELRHYYEELSVNSKTTETMMIHRAGGVQQKVAEKLISIDKRLKELRGISPSPPSLLEFRIKEYQKAIEAEAGEMVKSSYQRAIEWAAANPPSEADGQYMDVSTTDGDLIRFRRMRSKKGEEYWHCLTKERK